MVVVHPSGLPTVLDRTGAALAAVCGAAVLLSALTGPRGLFTASAWGLVAVLIALVWWRIERSTGLERTRLLWLAGGVVAPGLALGQVAFAVQRASAAPLAALLLAVAAALAALLLGLRAPLVVDVRRLISQVTRYAVSVEVALALFSGGRALVTAVRGEPLGTAATGVLAVAVATAFHPVSLLVRRLFDELLFGGRRDPVAVMSSLSAQLRTASTPTEWVASLRADLGASRVELWDLEELLASAEVPDPPEDDGAGPSTGHPATARVALEVGEDPVGALVVVLETPDEAAAGQLRRLLELLAPPLARALHGLALARQLAAERSQALAALEEERRRLRRDLHDGLGPVLTGIAYSADAARNLVRSDVEGAREQVDGLLADLREDAASSIAEVRRLVVGLRPAALDERGLVAAVRQQVARLGAAHASALVVAVQERDLPPVLPAAVEVAAYRVAVEAVTNAARHAHPGTEGSLRVTVCFERRREGLVVSVEDDGLPGGPWRAGVGTASMRERCEQLHGSLHAGPTAEGGRVRAVLPLPGPASA